MNNNIRNLIIGELCIVPETIQDAEDIYKYMGCDSEITKYTGWNPYESLESTIEKIENDIRDDNSYSWVIKKDGKFIGTFGAYDYDEKDFSIEIGYSIARKFWGEGYAGTAAKAVTDFLKSQDNIKVIRAWSNENNIASIKVLHKAGFYEIGKDNEKIIFESK